MNVTKNIAEYVKRKAINLSAMSRETGITYAALYGSLGDHSKERRPLSADEAVLICKYLEVRVEDFADEPGEKEKEVV